MEQNICQVETVTFNQKENEMVSVAEKILLQNHLALIASGASSCIRELYTKARRIGKLTQFFPCEITKEEYAAGIQGQKIQESLEEALQVDGIEGIIIYASCLDIMTQTDFEGIIQNLDNPKTIPIEVLYRGPLVKRYQKPSVILDEILERMPTNSDSKIKRSLTKLPPIFPDFNNICAALQHWDSYIFLLTAGGCASVFFDTGTPDFPYHVKNSRLTDVQITMGCEEAIENGVIKDFKESNKSEVFLLGSVVPAFTGVNYEQICDNLTKKGVSSIYLPSDGFAPGPVSTSKAMVTLAQRLLKPLPKEKGRINVLGYNPAVIGRENKISHGIEHMEWRGFIGTIWGKGGLEEAKKASSAELNWVVSTEGLELAKYMEKEFAIPYISGIPAGMQSMISWRKEVNVQMNRDDEELPNIEIAKPMSQQIPILIIGEPLLSISLEKAFHQTFGLLNTHRAAYAPFASLRRFYKEQLNEQTPEFFTNIEEFHQLLTSGGIVVADPIYKEYIDQMNLDCQFLPVPDPSISGSEYLDMDYAILGKKGGLYIRKFLEKCGIISDSENHQGEEECHHPHM
ncbi:hypothetical protein P261_01074 [Lachnospiraceae bacterium TWA4]|nr:hypothetical protein P261_01074 [Lachnospiraceae bacterium TWA4]